MLFFWELQELQWVILRGCSKLISLPSVKPLKRLEMLDLSHCSALRKFAAAVLQNSPIQMLDLSYTALKSIPTFKDTPNLTQLFVRNLKVAVLSALKQVTSLEVLDLSGAENVTEIKQLVGNKNLIVLDLSRTKITSINFLSDLFDLRNLILQECTSLETIPEMKHLTNLEVLDISNCKSLSDLPEDLSNLRNLKEVDISGCSGLEGLRDGVFDQMTCLEKLDLSKTRVNRLPSFANLVNLCKLSLRGLQLDSLETLACLSHLVELDLTGLQISSSQELNLDFLKFLQNLLILNISHTSVVTLPDISKIVNLKELVLASCQHLKILSHLHTLTNMETLDLSLPLDNTTNNVQEYIESEAQTIQFLSAPSNLRKLLLANRPGVLKLFPLTSLSNLEYLDIRGTDEIDFIRAHSSKMENLEVVVGWDSTTHRETAQGRTSKLDELHVVSTFYQSGFERFKTKFTKIKHFILTIQQSMRLANFENQVLMRHFGSMLTDLQYLLENISLLESSHDAKSSEGLLHELVDAATYHSPDEFLDSNNLDVLLRLILKLKLHVPNIQVDDIEALKISKKEKKLQFTWRKDEYWSYTDYAKESDGRENLPSSYGSLTDIERKCLLCFSVFPCREVRQENTGVLKSRSLEIKKRMLIHWWVGEGFIENPQPTPNHEMGSRTDTSAARYDAKQASQQVSTIEIVKKSKTTEEMGKEILRSLEKNKFIETVMNKGQDSGSCCMLPFVHSFVTECAMKECFFDFHPHYGMLVPHFTRSKRACLLKFKDTSSSSCKLWANYTSSAKRLESFNTIHALVNVNEPTIDIRAEWFSKMKDLFVLHLGSWGFLNDNHIEVVDQKFLEDLKAMKQLRLLNLQGFSAITKLPDSVCKLANLRILNLRDCSYLEELPDDIGSLKNLIHLDVTHCRQLSMLPKRVRLLSKIEVLKGFMITYLGGGQQHAKACILRDLLKLEKMEKLSLIVNIDRFPSSEDLQIFKEMRNLCNLKITWEMNYIISQDAQAAIPHEALRRSRWKTLKFWESRAGQNDIEKSLRSNHLDNLQKLVLCCFPLETTPDWLDPTELQNLEKLYIVGGNLQNLRGTDQNTWNVKILRLKYLRKLKMVWLVLRNIFPNMTYLENHQCDKLTLFPCDDEGVWTIET